MNFLLIPQRDIAALIHLLIVVGVAALNGFLVIRRRLSISPLYCDVDSIYIHIYQALMQCTVSGSLRRPANNGWYAPGREVFILSGISISYPSTLRLILDSFIAVYVLCAVPNASSNTRRSVRRSIGNSSNENHFSIFRRAISTSQIRLYLGFVGLSMNTPLKNLAIFLL